MLHYRFATSADLASLCALGEEVNSIHHAAWPEVFAAAGASTRDREHWARSVGRDDATTIVAEASDSLVGFIALSCAIESNALFQPIRYAKVGSVGVTASHRGKGIGSELMALGEQWAIEQGAVDMRLTVWAFNEGALRLYAALGYEARSRGLGKRLRAASSSGLSLRIVDTFPEPEFSALTREAFAGYEKSRLLEDVLNEEAAARQTLAVASAGALRIGAFHDDRLVAWTYARPEGANFHMINSGVAPGHRRQGVYSKLVALTIEHARSRGHVAILSRHAAGNNAVIIAKLKLGFVVSGFEYSEVYGPLVRLTCLLGDLRRVLYQTRSAPIRRLDASDET